MFWIFTFKNKNLATKLQMIIRFTIFDPQREDHVFDKHTDNKQYPGGLARWENYPLFATPELMFPMKKKSKIFVKKIFIILLNFGKILLPRKNSDLIEQAFILETSLDRSIHHFINADASEKLIRRHLKYFED